MKFVNSIDVASAAVGDDEPPIPSPVNNPFTYISSVCTGVEYVLPQKSVHDCHGQENVLVDC